MYFKATAEYIDAVARSKHFVLIDVSNEQGHAFHLLFQGHFVITVLSCVPWSL